MDDQSQPPSETLDRRFAALRQWGDFTQAYSTATQEGLEHFWHEGGYLAYQVKWRIACVLGDPVAPKTSWESMLAAFAKQFPRHCFWQISAATAEVLERLGYWINEMGFDTRLDLVGYDFKGKRKERLRHATNWFNQHGFTVREGSFSAAGNGGLARVDAAEIAALSDAWIRSRPIRTGVRFFNRPIVIGDEPDVRKFFLFDPSGRSVALVFFDPIYRDGQVVGYSPAVKRRLPDAPLRAEEGITKFAIETFQREGRERVMLGLSPLADVTDPRFKANPLTHFSWSRGFDAWWINRFFYNLRGHADFRRRFDGVPEQTYYASKALFNDIRVVATLRLAGVL